MCAVVSVIVVFLFCANLGQLNIFNTFSYGNDKYGFKRKVKFGRYFVVVESTYADTVQSYLDRFEQQLCAEKPLYCNISPIRHTIATNSNQS